jgi:hypothetical protein
MKHTDPSHPGRRLDPRWLLAALLAGALIGGLLLGQALQLYAYAVPLCLPCIGIQ